MSMSEIPSIHHFPVRPDQIRAVRGLILPGSENSAQNIDESPFDPFFEGV
jgi:hypothetical protein